MQLGMSNIKIQKRVIRIIMNARNRFLLSVIQESKNSTIKITIYFFPLLLFVAKNRDLCESNSEIHNTNTRFSSDLHTPTANLTFQKGPFYFGIKVFNHLPTSIKNTSHYINQFTCVLKVFFFINSFYSEEYFAWNSNRDFSSV